MPPVGPTANPHDVTPTKQPDGAESGCRYMQIITGCGRTSKDATTGDHVQRSGRPSLDDRWPDFVDVMSSSGLVKYDDLAMIRRGMNILLGTDRCDEQVFEDDFEASLRMDKLILSRLNRRRRREYRRLKHTSEGPGIKSRLGKSLSPQI